MARYLVENGHVNVNATDHEDRTALHIASCNFKMITVRFLVERCNVNVDAIDTMGRTAVHLACLQCKELKKVRGASFIKFRCLKDWTAGQLEIVRYLAAEGKAKLELLTNEGRTALHIARRNLNVLLVHCLVEQWQF